MEEEIPNPLLSEPEVVEPVGENAPVGVTAAPVTRAAATFIFLTVALDMLAMGMIVPVLPKLPPALGVVEFLRGEITDCMVTALG